MQKSKGTVFVGMSGGVDSSVSAALLKEQGYDVVGIFIKVWQPDWAPCTWKQDRLDAMRVAAHLNIPFFTFDFEDVYKKEVVDYMVAEYQAGRTPNPDVMCNKSVKFGAFLTKARSMGAHYIATGHYAQIKMGDKGTYELHESTDKAKEQSYFLWNIRTTDLPAILFPVGHLTKTQVRALAAKYSLPTASKKDSQGLCFVGKVAMEDFLSHFIPKKRGNVLDGMGKVIGYHEGAAFLTIGQRHGFTITAGGTDKEPLYVTGRSVQNNTVTVQPRVEDGIDCATAIRTITLEQCNWVSGKNIHEFIDVPLTVRYRYHQEAQGCTITPDGDKKMIVTFTQPQYAISPGQSAVLYLNGLCFGGGIIEKVA
jgi:tRNA-specific 2-thiouridylase